MKHYIFAMVCLLLVTACKENTSSLEIAVDEKLLLNAIKIISSDDMEGRFFGTEGNYKTQAYLAQQFDSLGIEPALTAGSIQKFPHTFSGKSRQRRYPIINPAEDFSNVPDTTIIGGNVVTMIKGKLEKTIVITAHLDHLGVKEGEIFNGADDDASGAAALLAIANYFKDKAPQHNLIFAAVDAEEIGSFGCTYLLENFPVPIENIVLNVNMDMIAHNDASELYASGLYHYPQLQQPLDALKGSKIKLLYGHDDPNDSKLDDWTFSSDHRVFHKQGIPFIYFGVEDHKDYHKATDTFENINQAFYIEAVRLIIEAIEAYDSFLVSTSKDVL